MLGFDWLQSRYDYLKPFTKLQAHLPQGVLYLTCFKDFLHGWMIPGFLAAIHIVDKIAGTNYQHPALLQRRALNSLLQIAGPQSTDSRFQWIKSHQ